MTSQQSCKDIEELHRGGKGVQPAAASGSCTPEALGKVGDCDSNRPGAARLCRVLLARGRQLALRACHSDFPSD